MRSAHQTQPPHDPLAVSGCLGTSVKMHEDLSHVISIYLSRDLSIYLIYLSISYFLTSVSRAPLLHCTPDTILHSILKAQTKNSQQLENISAA
jgi:hypothetical protein